VLKDSYNLQNFLSRVVDAKTKELFKEAKEIQKVNRIGDLITINGKVSA